VFFAAIRQILDRAGQRRPCEEREDVALRDSTSADDPHARQPLLWGGASLADARRAVILVHGRGGSPEDILGLAKELNVQDAAYLAPAAAGRTWYPLSFLAPIDQNEPAMSSALRMLARLVDMLTDQGVPADRIMILGFSQGACLGLEFAARHARRYAGVVGLSGGLIGPPGTPRDYAGTLAGTPVFLGCSDVDPHIPLARVHESADVFRRLGAVVDEKIYPRMGHTINRDEVNAVSALLRSDSSDAVR
jgi:predicted esterase